MGDAMTFPETFEEFAKSYKIVDSKQVYTNGTELIPIFRVKQWLEHKDKNIVFVGSRGCGKTLLQMNQIESTINTIKAEAIKEFWNNRPEYLNEDYKGKEEYNIGWNSCLDEFWEIKNNLLKEMVGEG